MHISRLDAHAAQLATEAIVVGVYAGGDFTAAAAEIDKVSGGVLRGLFETKELTGKACEVVQILAPLHGVSARKVVVVGLGERKALDRGTAFRVAASAAQALAGKRHQQVAFFLGDDWSRELNEAGVAGAMVGCQGQDLYRSERKKFPFGELLWSGGDAPGVDTGQIIGQAINLARRLVNEPPNKLYPEAFAAVATEVAAETKLEIEIWDQARLQTERCGSLLAVAQGSPREPRLIILRHRGGGPSAAPLALVGKGVTFDSGGLSLKPTDSMKTMKCDMAGAATVLGAMQAIAQLRLPLNVVGLVGLVENMPAGNAFKVGDVLTARSGKTIEVLNTDAEGRLVLADVLNVAVELGADRIIDLATLTGACVVALGMDVAGLMSNDDPFSDLVLKSAKEVGEPMWPLPMFPEFREHILSDIADIKNVGDGRWGGAISAAKFLQEFVGDTPWVHLDIAGPAFLERYKPWCDGGGTGAFVRTLVEVVRNRKK